MTNTYCTTSVRNVTCIHRYTPTYTHTTTQPPTHPHTHLIMVSPSKPCNRLNTTQDSYSNLLLRASRKGDSDGSNHLTENGAAKCEQITNRAAVVTMEIAACNWKEHSPSVRGCFPSVPIKDLFNKLSSCSRPSLSTPLPCDKHSEAKRC